MLKYFYNLYDCGRISKMIACVASVSVEQKAKNRVFGVLPGESLHLSPCNSLLPDCTETLATQATKMMWFDPFYRSDIWSISKGDEMVVPSRTMHEKSYNIGFELWKLPWPPQNIKDVSLIIESQDPSSNKEIIQFLKKKISFQK